MNIEDKLKKDELQKIQNYLQDSKKNVDKLKQGKRPKRKLTYFIQDNKRWVIFFSVLLVTTPFLAFLYQPTQDLINPYTDTILDTIDTHKKMTDEFEQSGIETAAFFGRLLYTGCPD